MCGAEIPLVAQFWLAKKSNKQIAYRPIVHDGQVEFELLQDAEAIKAAGFDPSAGTVSRGNARCPVCGQVTPVNAIRSLARKGRMDQRMVAVVLHHPNEVGKKYRLAEPEDEETYAEAATYLGTKLANWPFLDDPLPGESVDERDHAVNRLPMYGMPTWKDMFNARQQLALVTLLEKIKTTRAGIHADCAKLRSRVAIDASWNADTLAAAVTGYIAIVLDRQADCCNSLTSWHNTGEKLNHLFGRQAIPMSWDYVELNPTSGSGGDWLSHLAWVLRYIEGNPVIPEGNSSAHRASATALPLASDYLDAILTDPPYYDNVPYAALSDFFYVWLKCSVGEVFPELFATPVVAKTDEAIMELTRHASSAKAKAFFERMLGKAFCEMHRVLRPDGIAVVVYAHKTTEGWETMLNALVQAGLVVTGSWPMHTEMGSRLRAAASAALASSIYMVCRKSEREPLGFWNELQPQIQARIEEKMAQFWAEGIAGGDFFISAIGPGMEAYSRYERVETYAGEPVGVDTLLAFIRSVGHRLAGPPAAAGRIRRRDRQGGAVLPRLPLDLPRERGALRRRAQDRQRRGRGPGAALGQGRLREQERGQQSGCWGRSGAGR